MFRLLYRLYRLYLRVRHWAQRRFTRAGLTVLGVLVVAAIMGPDTENNVTYQAFSLLLAILLLAFSFGWLFRARFRVARRLPRFGTVGQPLAYTVAVQNLSRHHQTGLTLLEELTDLCPSFQDWKALQLADLREAGSFRLVRGRRVNPFKFATVQEAAVPPARANQEVETRLELMPLRRGLLRFQSLTLARPDPLGLFRAFARVPSPQTTLILPKRYFLPPIGLPGTMKYQQGGVALASSVGQSDEFVGLRDYRRGDPVRHIHWRSWAKAGKPVVKEFEDEFFVRHALVLDTFTGNPHSEAFEEAVSVAASFACTIQTQESLLDLLFVGLESYCFTAGRGLAQADQMLEVLASVRVCRGQSFGALERLVVDHARLVSGCICVLLAWDRERRQFIRKLQALGVPVLVLVIVEPGQRRAVEAGPAGDRPERFLILEVGQVEQQLARLS